MSHTCTSSCVCLLASHRGGATRARCHSICGTLWHGGATRVRHQNLLNPLRGLACLQGADGSLVELRLGQKTEQGPSSSTDKLLMISDSELSSESRRDSESDTSPVPLIPPIPGKQTKNTTRASSTRKSSQKLQHTPQFNGESSCPRRMSMMDV